MTIPGVQQRTAEVLIAEIGIDMNALPHRQAPRLVGRACARQRRIRRQTPLGQDPQGLQVAATRRSTEAALAASRTKDSYLAAQYQRLRGRRGHSKAVTAVGHSILTAAWHMLQTGELYRDLGGDYYTRQNPDRLTKRLVRQLEALGHHVTLQPRQVAA